MGDIVQWVNVPGIPMRIITDDARKDTVIVASANVATGTTDFFTVDVPSGGIAPLVATCSDGTNPIDHLCGDGSQVQ